MSDGLHIDYEEYCERCGEKKSTIAVQVDIHNNLWEFYCTDCHEKLSPYWHEYTRLQALAALVQNQDGSEGELVTALESAEETCSVASSCANYRELAQAETVLLNQALAHARAIMEDTSDDGNCS